MTTVSSDFITDLISWHQPSFYHFGWFVNITFYPEAIKISHYAIRALDKRECLMIIRDNIFVNSAQKRML